MVKLTLLTLPPPPLRKHKFAKLLKAIDDFDVAFSLVGWSPSVQFGKVY